MFAALTGGIFSNEPLHINAFDHIAAPQAKKIARLRVFGNFYLSKMGFGANIF